MTPALAPTQVGPERRPGATLDSAATRPRRGRPAGTLRVRRAYRPCLLTWVSGEPTAALIEQMRGAALARDRSSLLVPLDRATQVMLLAEDSPERPSRELVGEAVQSVVDAVRALRPEARIHAVVGDRVAPGERLEIAAARLRRLARHALAGPGNDLVWARRYSLACLLETLEPRQTAGFVEEQLAGLRAYDRGHGTNLQRVLELALDHPNRNRAASAAFMHRNTFRRQLGKALELVDADLGDPVERLALHVALKLRSLGEPAQLAGRCGGSGSDAGIPPASPRAAPSARRR
jgi:sugar diacid utilization regulator